MLHKDDIIGYYNLKEGRNFIQHYEYAGAETHIYVDRGRYPIVYAHPNTNHCMFVANLPGKISYDYFVNRIGYHMKAADRRHMIGKDASYALCWSPMDFTSPPDNIELLDTIVFDVLDSVYGKGCSPDLVGKNLTRINITESIGGVPNDEGAYPGSEHLHSYMET